MEGKEKEELNDRVRAAQVDDHIASVQARYDCAKREMADATIARRESGAGDIEAHSVDRIAEDVATFRQALGLDGFRMTASGGLTDQLRGERARLVVALRPLRVDP